MPGVPFWPCAYAINNAKSANKIKKNEIKKVEEECKCLAGWSAGVVQEDEEKKQQPGKVCYFV